LPSLLGDSFNTAQPSIVTLAGKPSTVASAGKQDEQLQIIFIFLFCSCRVYSAILLTPPTPPLWHWRASPPLWHWRASKMGNYILFSFFCSV